MPKQVAFSFEKHLFRLFYIDTFAGPDRLKVMNYCNVFIYHGVGTPHKTEVY